MWSEKGCRGERRHLARRPGTNKPTLGPQCASSAGVRWWKTRGKDGGETGVAQTGGARPERGTGVEDGETERQAHVGQRQAGGYRDASRRIMNKVRKTALARNRK